MVALGAGEMKIAAGSDQSARGAHWLAKPMGSDHQMLHEGDSKVGGLAVFSGGGLGRHGSSPWVDQTGERLRNPFTAPRRRSFAPVGRSGRTLRSSKPGRIETASWKRTASVVGEIPKKGRPEGRLKQRYNRVLYALTSCGPGARRCNCHGPLRRPCRRFRRGSGGGGWSCRYPPHPRPSRWPDTLRRSCRRRRGRRWCRR